MILRFHDGEEFNVVPNNEHSTAAIMRIHAYAFGLKQLQKHGLNDWTFKIERLNDSILGTCSFNSKRISINSIYFHFIDLPNIEDTILHEIAHALVGPDYEHDNHWHIKALFIGCCGQPETAIYLSEMDNDSYKLRLIKKGK